MVQQSSAFDWNALPGRDSHVVEPGIRTLDIADLREVLRAGVADFARNRTDLFFMCVIYPVIGMVLAQFALGAGLMPILFPTLTGFALVGPVAAVGLNEMSRRLERGESPGAFSMFGVLRSAQIGGIVVFAVVLAFFFVAWLFTAQQIYLLTMGHAEPASAMGFVHDVLTTRPGWALIVLGMGAGFGFAVVVLCLSLVTFPMLLDRPVNVVTAMRTSLRAAARNPGTVAAWGLLLAVAMVLGSLPALLGLAFVLPIFGHATWHLYRRMVV
jgi:uncharacterized membrane protein